MPYHVFGDRSGAAAVTVTCTRSASACRPSAFLAPFLPSARSSAARSFIAARSSALKPWDSVLAFFEGILGFPSRCSGLDVLTAFRPKIRPDQTVGLLDS